MFLPLLTKLRIFSDQRRRSTMQALKSSLNLTKDVDWSNPNPCKWPTVQCAASNRVTRIQLKTKGIRGILPPNLQTLRELIVLELFQNQISSLIPDLSGLTWLQTLNLHDNLFDSVPKKLTSRTTLSLPGR
uniref:Leucine-rich repeat-containing N-terminal plant-type domain-containing protein n=1 Tax=Brassica oleracea var. oleracea TaxID=109376 RepID=A0A0D3ARM2_BRAOL